MAVITNGNIDQAKLLLFEKNFEKIANQRDSKLLNTPAIKFMDIKGISNVSRIDSNELVDVTAKGRNPDKSYVDMRNDNRKSIAKRLTATYLVDDYDKAVNLITDPTSYLFDNLKEAKSRAADAFVTHVATADVVVGAPDAAGTTVTAEEDDVLTIDGKTTFDYKTVISPAITAFTNNYIDCSMGTTLAISATEEEHLRNDEYYMNAYYSKQNTVDKGAITNASGFNVVTFAGSVNGGATVEMPILNEKEGVRTNLLLAPQSIAFAVEVGRLDIERAAGKVNSWEITIDLWLKGLRLQGAKVIKLLSTI